MKTVSRMLFIAAFFMFIITVLVVTLGKNNITASFFENRALKGIPAFSQEKLVNDEYFKNWETWFTDHAAGRNTLLKANSWLELNVLHMPVVSNVVVQDDVLLSYIKYGRWSTSSYKDISEHTAKNLRDFADYVHTLGGKFYYMGLPEQFSYFNHLYPDYLENREWALRPMHTYFAQAMQKYGVNYINMYEVYNALNRPKEYYSLTDHHYTFYGALKAYKTLLDTINDDTDMNLRILDDDDMKIIELPNPYLGSRNRKLCGMRYMGEHAAYAVLNAPIPFSRWDNGIQTDAPVYNLPDSSEKIIDYNLYMKEDYAETIIRTNREKLPNALIFGDSFTNAIETLLYTAFNETRSLDLRYYTEKTLREYIAEYKPAVVICVRDDTAFFSEEGNGNLK